VAANWELALISFIERESVQLRWLANGTDEIEKGDVHAQISRMSGLTDLAHPDGLPLSETSVAKLRLINEEVMEIARSVAFISNG
jgi:hypothetical protein